MTARTPTRLLANAALVALGIVVATVHGIGPAAAAEYVPISGAGSTWSQNALAQWQVNVKQYGLEVNYQGTGSSDGRNQFRNGTVDYAVSEIPYGLTDGGVVDTPPERKYAYMPIVAGGTSFMYNLTLGNDRVTSLRLSGETLAKIFTGVITNWGDAAIKADNPGLTLPARGIVPVVRSDGSGTTAQLTTWLSKEYPDLWNAYCAKAGRPSNPCGVTSNFPLVGGSAFTAQSGSLGVSGYVSQGGNVGTITYVEYSYALNTNFPVAKVLNKSGYYTLPSASNVAVGLLGATINNNASSPQYLTQDLTNVYRNSDPRTYPLSSYSYMIVPTKIEGSFDENKGYTLGAFAYYFLCEGQQQADDLGYSPLPINLVQAGLKQVQRIPGVEKQNIDIKKCNNPTFSSSGKNTLAANAPQPADCDKQGPRQCGTPAENAPTDGGSNNPDPSANPTTDPGSGGPDGGGGGPGDDGGSNPGTGGGNPSNNPSGSPTPGATNGGGNPTPGASNGAGGGGAIDPDTGQVVSDDGDGTTVAGGTVPVSAVSVLAPATTGWGTQQTLMLIAVLLLIAVMIVPPLVLRQLRIRRDGA